MDDLRPAARRALQTCALGEPPRTLEAWLKETADGESDLAALLDYDGLARGHSLASFDAARATLDSPGFANRTRVSLIEAVLSILTRPIQRREA
jgi:hypothetical protein